MMKRGRRWTQEMEKEARKDRGCKGDNDEMEVFSREEKEGATFDCEEEKYGKNDKKHIRRKRRRGNTEVGT